MAKLYDVESGSLIGTITDRQLQVLIDQLEEEDSEDQDYYIDQATLEWFEEQNVDPGLVGLLGKALGMREGMDIRWSKD
jgi:hypothetical protein